MYLMLQVIFGGHIFGPVVNILYNKYTAVGYSFAKFFYCLFFVHRLDGRGGADNAGKFNFANGFNCSVPIKPR